MTRRRNVDANGAWRGALALAGGLLGGCGVEVLDASGTSDVPEVVAEALDRSCAVSGCHDATDPAEGLALTGAALESLLGAKSSQRPDLDLVRIGDIAGSYLALKMLPSDVVAGYGESIASGTSQMPLSGSTTQSQEDVALVLGWIGGAPLPPPTSDDGPMPTGESFEEDILPILQVGCGCHQVGDGAGGLRYTVDDAYDVLVGQPSTIAGLDYVVPDDPDSSYLLAKAEGRHLELGGDGERMPPAPLSALDADQLGLIRTWISLGANP